MVISGLSRRDFLAGMCAAGLGGCSKTSIPLEETSAVDPFSIEFNKLLDYSDESAKTREWARMVDLYKENKQHQALALIIPSLYVKGGLSGTPLNHGIKFPPEIMESANFKPVVSLINDKKEPYEAWDLLVKQVSNLRNKYLKYGIALTSEIQTGRFTDEDKQFLLNAVKVARAMIHDGPIATQFTNRELHYIPDRPKSIHEAVI